MPNRKRLYRVTAVYLTDHGPERVTRTYQTRQAAEHRAALWRDGRPPAQVEYDHLNGERWEDEIPKATQVWIDRSDPVTFPADRLDTIATAALGNPDAP